MATKKMARQAGAAASAKPKKKRRRRPDQKAFVEAQVAKGRSRAQALVSYRLALGAYIGARAIGRQMKYRRRRGRRLYSMKSLAALERRLRIMMIGPYRPVHKDRVEQLLYQHFKTLKVWKPKRIVWLASPAALPAGVKFSHTYLHALDKVLRYYRFFNWLDERVLSLSLGEAPETATMRWAPLLHRPDSVGTSAIVATAVSRPGSFVQQVRESAYAGLFCFWACSNHVVYALPRPLLNVVRDETQPIRTRMRANGGRLHNESGPAILWPDGQTVFCLHNVAVDEAVVRDPQSITVEQIDQCTNTEVRRVLIETYGAERYLRDGQAVLIHEDECGKLWGKPMWGDEPLVMVQVKNSTPEPSGDYKNYWLRVPFTMRTAREAVAWTFQMEGEEYEPIVET